MNFVTLAHNEISNEKENKEKMRKIENRKITGKANQDRDGSKKKNQNSARLFSQDDRRQFSSSARQFSINYQNRTVHSSPSGL